MLLFFMPMPCHAAFAASRYAITLMLFAMMMRVMLDDVATPIAASDICHDTLSITPVATFLSFHAVAAYGFFAMFSFRLLFASFLLPP